MRPGGSSRGRAEKLRSSDSCPAAFSLFSLTRPLNVIRHIDQSVHSLQLLLIMTPDLCLWIYIMDLLIIVCCCLWIIGADLSFSDYINNWSTLKVTHKGKNYNKIVLIFYLLSDIYAIYTYHLNPHIQLTTFLFCYIYYRPYWPKICISVISKMTCLQTIDAVYITFFYSGKFFQSSLSFLFFWYCDKYRIMTFGYRYIPS